MKASDFTKIVKDWAVSKKLEWTSFKEGRVYDIGKKFEKDGDIEQILKDVSGEFKSYEVSRDDVKILKEKLGK